MRRILSGYFIFSILLVILIAGKTYADKEVSSEVDLKKRADRYFTTENYEKALPDYSRLLSIYPRETIYNYRFGVCLLLSGKEKSNAATYLETSSKDPNVEEEVWYYLGKSYMINNEFTKANDAFVKFKSIASSSKQKKFEIDACIKNCESGITLSKTRKNVVIVNSTDVERKTFFNNYDFTTTSGKIVSAADQFMTELDRAKQKDNVMYISNDKQKVLISSYGKSGETGKDIYIVRKSPDGTWSQPESIGNTVNSSTDEDFPFLDRDGRTLYFSSKGFNSIGGYDIFKSVFDFTTSSWSAPENLGMPINTTGDDFLFVPDENGANVSYATNVESPENLIELRKIKLPAGRNEMLTISGTYIPEDQKMRRDARISILTSSGDGIITSVHTDPATGKYQFALPPGQNYMIVVEGGGYLPHAEMFDLPAGMVNPDLKQVVKINKKDQVEQITLQNYFTSGGTPLASKTITHSYSTKVDSSSLMSVKINDQIIYVTAPEKNTGEVTAATNPAQNTNSAVSEEELLDNSDTLPVIDTKKKDKYDPMLAPAYSQDQLKQQKEEAERQKEVKEDEANPEKTLDINVSNEELAKIAYNDAKAIQDEADSVKNEIDVLRTKAVEKQDLSDAQKKQSEAKGIPADSSVALMSQSETNHVEADELSKQADALEIIAASKQAEAKTAVDEANLIFSSGKSSGTLASGNKKSLKDKQDIISEKAPENINQESVQNTVGTDSSVVSKPVSETDKTNTAVNTTPPPAANQEGAYDAPLISEEVTLPGQGDNSCNDNVPPANANQNVTAIKDSSSNKNTNTISPQSEPLSVNIIKTEQSTSIGRFLINEVDTNSTSKSTPSDKLNKNQSESISSQKENNPVAPQQSSMNNSSVATTAAHVDALKDSITATTTESNVESKTPDGTTSPVTNNATSIVNQKDSLSTVASVTSSNVNQKNSSTAVNDSNEIAAHNANVNSSSDSLQKNTLISSNTTGVITSENTSVNTTALNNTSPNTNVPNAKQEISGAHHADSIFAVSDAMIKKHAPLPVKEEAKVAYRQYQAKIKHSTELTTLSLGLQKEISHLHPCPERDSLIRESNQASIEAVHEWQEGLKLIQEARKIDPGVEYKMGVNDYAENINKNDTATFGLNKADADKLQANALTNKSPQANDSLNNFDYTSGSTDSSIKYYQDKNESEANLDTLNPEYPKYVKLKKDINDQQVETIDIFAEAINLNKKSIEEKENEIAFMDSAQKETDKDKKSALIKLSFEQKALSEKHASEAKEKFAMAQKHTQDVKGLKTELALVKERITLKPDQNNLTASTANTNNVKPLIKSKVPSDKIAPVTKPGSTKNQNSKTNQDTIKKNPVFASNDSKNVNLSADEESIESVDVTKSSLDKFMVDVFGKNQSPYYSDKNPIPMDPKLPDGLVFKVQIGAFHNPLPSDIFKGIQPISGETTRPGWVRYCAGLFKAFEPAVIVKKEIQKMGYKDAFVVAYFNGKRIELNDAYAMLRAKESVVAYKSESAKEIAMLRAINIHDEPASLNNNEDKDEDSFYGKNSSTEKAVDNSKKEFAVQLGVFNSPNAPEYIASIKPLQTVPTQSKLYRFTTGRFNSRKMAETVKQQMIKSGIKDAFVVAYRNGVVVNSDEAVVDERPAQNPVNEDISNPSFLAHQMVYTIQIGAFKNDIPYNMIESYMHIIDKGIFERTNERGLHVFYVGNFKTFNEASALIGEIVSKGVKDAFIVALSDGKRIPISDEMKK